MVLYILIFMVCWDFHVNSSKDHIKRIKLYRLLQQF